MSDPAAWNKVPFDPSKTAPERTVVPGIAEATQPLMLFAGEWMCPGCQAVIAEVETDHGTVVAEDGKRYGMAMVHASGCSTVADIVEQARG